MNGIVTDLIGTKVTATVMSRQYKGTIRAVGFYQTGPGFMYTIELEYTHILMQVAGTYEITVCHE